MNWGPGPEAQNLMGATQHVRRSDPGYRPSLWSCKASERSPPKSFICASFSELSSISQFIGTMNAFTDEPAYLRSLPSRTLSTFSITSSRPFEPSQRPSLPYLHFLHIQSPAIQTSRFILLMRIIYYNTS